MSTFAFSYFAQFVPVRATESDSDRILRLSRVALVVTAYMQSCLTNDVVAFVPLDMSRYLSINITNVGNGPDMTSDEIMAFAHSLASLNIDIVQLARHLYAAFQYSNAECDMKIFYNDRTLIDGSPSWYVNYTVDFLLSTSVTDLQNIDNCLSTSANADQMAYFLSNYRAMLSLPDDALRCYYASRNFKQAFSHS